MRDPRYENMWGENPEEQERRRQWLGDVYDRAAGLKSGQTPIPDHGQFNQTPYNPSNQFGQTSYQPKNDWEEKNIYKQNLSTNQSLKNNPIQQVNGAITDLIRNYYDMKDDHTIGADDYFHCKGNFEASQRGVYGEKTAEILGDAKERIDYFKNRLFRGLNASEAYEDYLHDKDVNMQGRHQAKTGLYSNARDACAYKRVKGINEKY